MRPKKPETTGSTDLFRARLDQIINLKHELAQLAGKIDWDWVDGEIAPLYSDKGRPGIETRFAIGLLLLDARDAAASHRLAETARIPVAVWLRGHAQSRQAARNPRAHARSGIPYRVRRHRNSGSRCAQANAQGAECDAADAGSDRHAQQLRARGH